MAGIVPNNGEKLMLDSITAKAATDSWKVHLFKNNYTPSESTIAADLTEADFAGYAAVDSLSWDAASTDINGKAFSTHAAADFVRSSTGSSQTIYGWWLAGSSGQPLAIERLAAPITVTNEDDTISVSITLRLWSAN